MITVIALICSIGLFVGSILTQTDNPAIFVSMSSVVIVVGGSLTAAFISYEPRYVILSLKLIGKVIFAAKIGRGVLKAEVGRVIRWAYTVQKSGIPALEAEAKKAVKGDKFLKFGIEMVISGYSGNEVKEILTNTIDTTFVRNTIQVHILNFLSGACPAFGMVGTLIGLIIMLANMGGDPSALGAGLSVALLTTMYGVLFSRLIFSPVATKIMQREQIVRFRNNLIVEGLVLIAEKKSPRFIQDKMNSHLDPTLHYNIDKDKK